MVIIEGENTCRFDDIISGKKSGYTCVAYMVNSCQEKVAGVLFWQYYSFYYHALALEKMFCLDGIGAVINLGEVNLIPCLCTVALSLSRTASRMSGYIVSIYRNDN